LALGLDVAKPEPIEAAAEGGRAMTLRRHYFVRDNASHTPPPINMPARRPWRKLLATISVTVGPGTITTTIQASRKVK
jgi:hypothetical protein